MRLSFGKFGNTVKSEFGIILHLIFIFKASVCSPPEDGINTKMVEKGVYYEVGDYYTYECDNDKVIFGEKVAACLSNLTWSLSPPTCVGKTYVLIKSNRVIAVMWLSSK